MTLTAIILTFNEELHIARCIESLRPVAERIVVVDSFSTDRTVALARDLGAEVFQNPFTHQAQQYQWALENTAIITGWTLRVDADEYLEPALQRSLRDFLADPGEVNAVYLRRKICFFGRPITHGFFYPLKILRLHRTGQGRMEQRWMDEHIVVENAATRVLDGDLVDDNLNPLGWWTAKHVGYAQREAYQIMASHAENIRGVSLTGQARRKRWLKQNVYNRLPYAFRSTLYFFYRYVLGRGFLDGKEGFYFHFLQAYWYRTYVDATLFEMERKAAAEGLNIYEMLKRDGNL